MGHVNKHLAKKIRTLRGDMPLRHFAKKLGISKSTLHRIEMEKNVSLETLEQMSKQLKCELADLLRSEK